MGKRKNMKRQHSDNEHKPHQHRERHPKRNGPSKGAIVFLSIFGLIILYSGFVALGGGDRGYTADPSMDYDALSACILENEAIFFGTEWCQFCTRQKELLGPTFQEHGDEFFVDCDLNQDECRSAGVTSYPSWYINGRLLSGVQQIDTLASELDCAL